MRETCSIIQCFDDAENEKESLKLKFTEFNGNTNTSDFMAVE